MTPTHQDTVYKRCRDKCWPEIGTKDSIPGWLKDNDYIVTGHPMPTYSYRRSLRLWRCLHMETMNMWTHALATVAFFIIGILLLKYADSSGVSYPVTGELFVFGSFITAAILCFTFSTIFHTLRSHSYIIHHFTGKLDILGICILALGGGVSATYYASYCNPVIQKLCWSIESVSALAAAVVLFDTGGGGTKMRALRGAVFSALVISVMLPILHAIGRLGWAQACQEIGTQYYLAEALALSFGVTLFVFRVPERFSPGTFDIWGHSHQLHHIFAAIGTAFHLLALMEGYRYRQSHHMCLDEGKWLGMWERKLKQYR